MPSVMGGLSLGSWTASEPGRAPGWVPAPGALAVMSPLAWYDSVRVVAGSGGAWNGWGAGLATVSGLSGAGASRHARSVVDLRNGSFGYDENTLSLARGDSTQWFRGETSSGSRTAVEGYDSFGRHLWGASGSLRARRHQVIEGGYSNRGLSNRLLGSEEETARGESGTIGWRYNTALVSVALHGERARDRRESFADYLALARRTASSDRVFGEARVATRWGDVASRLEIRHDHVVRTSEDPLEGGFDRNVRSAWAAGSLESMVGDGLLRFDLGIGRHTGFPRMEVAPEVSYHVQRSNVEGRIALERLLVPVWSDLGIGQGDFLQRTWAGVIDVGVGRPGVRRLAVTYLGGRTTDRAVVLRHPITDLWLREGAYADPDPYAFGLLSVTGEWAGRVLAWRAEGFALSRDPSVVQNRVDPAYGLRATGTWHFSAFQGDLDVRLSGGMDAIGPRETESEGRVLPGYVTSEAGIIATISDAVLTVRARNLEDRHSEEVWFDSATGAEALTPGRELRFTLTLHLFD